MLKKKILFIMESLRIGGAEKSLLTILSVIDYNKYDVDLLLFNQTGDFLNMIPKQVNILPESKKYKIFNANRRLSPIKFLIKLDFVGFYHSICWLINALISKVKKEKLYIGWNHIKYFFNNIKEEYDTSIAFLERKTIYFNIDKVQAKNKIGFIHSDYSKYPYNDKLDRYYFKNYNKIATVSEHSKDVLIELFPEYQDKFIVIKNMISKDLIIKLSKEKIQNYKIDKQYLNIVSVGRLVKPKGFDQIIEICNKLRKKKIKTHWYIIGEGEEKSKLEKLIENNNLKNTIYLVGADTNPYKWMNIADIYVQPSRYEGYGITVAEAKVLNKPIIASDIPAFKELLGNDLGLLADSVESFTHHIQLLIDDEKLRNKLVLNLKNENISLEELTKLYDIM